MSRQSFIGVMAAALAAAWGAPSHAHHSFSAEYDRDKPINWKRTIEHNGEYGVMGDLGMHACHVPFRAGWRPRNVRAILSDIVKQRPDGKGNLVPCRTWGSAPAVGIDQSSPCWGWITWPTRFPWRKP